MPVQLLMSITAAHDIISKLLCVLFSFKLTGDTSGAPVGVIGTLWIC